VVGQAQVLIGQLVEVGGGAFAGAGARVLQHATHDGRGAPAVLRDFEQVLLKVGQQFGFQGGVAGGPVLLFFQLGHQLGAHLGKVVDEVEWVLNFVGNTGGELAQAGHFFGLHQLGLRRAQLGEGRAQGFGLLREGSSSLGHQPLQLHVLSRNQALGFLFFFAQQPLVFQGFFLATSDKDKRSQPDDDETLGRVHHGIVARGHLARGVLNHKFKHFVEHERDRGQQQHAGRAVGTHGRQHGHHQHQHKQPIGIAKHWQPQAQHLVKDEQHHPGHPNPSQGPLPAGQAGGQVQKLPQAPHHQRGHWGQEQEFAAVGMHAHG